jgi:two-component system, chemotaxis family, chemotaxis protein CheY
MAGTAAVKSERVAVLIVDDSAYARLRLRRFMAARGFDRIVEAADGDEALACQAEHKPGLVLLDEVMRGRAGIDTARLLLAHDPAIDVIMLTVLTDRDVREHALSVGVKRVLAKADFTSLEAVLRELGHE